MDFNPHPPAEEDPRPVEPGVMHIGGPRGRRFRELARWLAVISIFAAILVLLFIRFGATTLWAAGLVLFMLTYMALMGRWAGGDHQR